MRFVEKISKTHISKGAYEEPAKKEFSKYTKTIEKSRDVKKRMQAMKFMDELTNEQNVLHFTNHILVRPAVDVFGEVVQGGRTEKERLKALTFLNNVMYKWSPEGDEPLDRGIDAMSWAMKNAPTPKERMSVINHFGKVVAEKTEDFFFTTDQGRIYTSNIFCILAEHAQTGETPQERALAIRSCTHIARAQPLVLADTITLLQDNLRHAATKKERMESIDWLSFVLRDYCETEPGEKAPRLGPSVIRQSLNVLQKCAEDQGLTKAEQDFAASTIDLLLDTPSILKHVSPEFLIRSQTLSFAPEQKIIKNRNSRLKEWLFNNGGDSSARKKLSKYAENCLDAATNELNKAEIDFGNNSPEIAFSDVQKSHAATEYYQRMQQKLKVV